MLRTKMRDLSGDSRERDVPGKKNLTDRPAGWMPGLGSQGLSVVLSQGLKVHMGDGSASELNHHSAFHRSDRGSMYVKRTVGEMNLN